MCRFLLQHPSPVLFQVGNGEMPVLAAYAGSVGSPELTEPQQQVT
jgi:hypothetical protein